MTDDTPRTKPNLWEYIGYSYGCWLRQPVTVPRRLAWSHRSTRWLLKAVVETAADGLRTVTRGTMYLQMF